ncbi:uncharacterized protein ACLA_061860 [Aspergillus clavatus NRRL 1]|uniref:AB hydrolase-1 domain-containing protein n=1 Tax=Aspergillus clavatus (strain ATCC 1007 / CBS 513.65 / DSM 816 / NCTC 3887 / NRRL 1 / QM 1276 / 107) TaxID=344612 RepID=A1CCG7_ASPCL|nr:uncharacterized protein ACLA_061860 [Aspergillus clavatus NRRL 1]EAW12224.1 conserved hypothetical protein [Aspergillus clavatus NRRL 1]
MRVSLELSLFSFLLPAVVASKPRCTEFKLPIHVSLSLPQFKVPRFDSSYESTAFLAASVSRTANLSALVAGQSQIDRSFGIYFRYCEPEKSKHRTDILQILSHGIGFDKSYWSFDGEEYDYIASATAAGYATLSYDRLGVGQSEQADPYFEIQVSTQVAILAQVTELVRNGQLWRRVPVPKKVVHVGHSFGSLITNGLVAAQPHLSDGIVLTGFSHNTSYTPLFETCLGFELARSNNPRRFRQHDSGYLTWGNEYANQCAFYTYPFFEPTVLQQAEASKAPFAISELLSFASVSLAAPNFTNPVLMLSGQFDLPFCGGECQGVLNGPASVSPFVFPNAHPFVSYVHPNAGHSLNLHHNASAAYGVITSFLQQQGL